LSLPGDAPPDILSLETLMITADRFAPGWPGIPARWTSSAKSGVGTALSSKSAVWFTLSHGIFNEIYYPRIDQACVRDMGMFVTDGAWFRSEEKRDAHTEVRWLEQGVPAFGTVSSCRQGRYRIEKEILSDPRREAVLQSTRFSALQGALSDYRLYVLRRRTWATRGRATPPGSASTRGSRCSSPSERAPLWPWPARSPGSCALSGSPAARTAGRT
jgi:hypothetical protein